MKAKLLTSLFLLGTGIVLAQPAERRVSRQEYIDMWKDEAVRQMHAHGIPASITLAQGILESANGNSALAKYANNHFGIKCHNWKGASFIQDDDLRNECFRKYESAKESFRDHSLFLTGRSRYAFLFSLSTTDYKGWAHGLKKAGYATNPRYGYLLVALIEDHHLYQYDQDNFVASVRPKTLIGGEEELTIRTGHTVRFKDNGVQFVIASKEDTFYKIAKEFNLNLWQLYKYNDLDTKAVLHVGDVIYVQNKRNRASADTHKVTGKDTMWRISQIYGIKLRKLYKKNNMSPGDEPQQGDIIHLRKRKKIAA